MTSMPTHQLQAHCAGRAVTPCSASSAGVLTIHGQWGQKTPQSTIHSFSFPLRHCTHIFKCFFSEPAENVPRNTTLFTQMYRGISYTRYSSRVWNSSQHVEQGSQNLKVLFCIAILMISKKLMKPDHCCWVVFVLFVLFLFAF